MADIDEGTWDGSASNYPSTADYCDACAINLNVGPRQNWVQAKCKLPYKTPSGAVSRAGVHAAAAALAGGRGGVAASPAVKKAAAKKLIGVYRNDLNEEPPDSLKKLAGM